MEIKRQGKQAPKFVRSTFLQASHFALSFQQFNECDGRSPLAPEGHKHLELERAFHLSLSLTWARLRMPVCLRVIFPSFYTVPELEHLLF